MSTVLFTYALFMIPLFLIGACLVTGLPVALSLRNYYRNRGPQSVKCPDSRQRADIEVDRKFAFWTALRGQEHTRLQSCSRWPEKSDCGQECLAQIDPSPENVERVLTKWYEGKSCALCNRPLTPADWQHSRLGVLNQQHQLLELRQLRLQEVALRLDQMQPLCWTCHQEEGARQARPTRVLKGERPVITMDELA